MRYIASLISGVGIFMMGAGLSWYHGIMGLLHPQPMESLLWVSVGARGEVREVVANVSARALMICFYLTGLLYFGRFPGVRRR